MTAARAAPLARPGPAASALSRGALPLALLAALVAALAPLLLTPALPLVDFYAHGVRYLALSGRPLPPAIAGSYEPAWQLLPNLGMDVVGAGLMRLLEPLAAMRAVGALMILAPVGGVLALSAAVHGRPTPVAALLGGVLAVNHVTVWGFTNFLVGLGLALAGTALWIALAGRPRVQIAAALLFGPVLLMVHGLSFALWGLMLGAVEIGRAWQGRAAGGMAPCALAWRMARLLALAVLPLLLWSRMPTGAAGGRTLFAEPIYADLPFWSGVAQELARRVPTIAAIGETGWRWADFGLGTALWALLGWALLRGGLRLHPLLVPAVLGTLALVLVAPSYLFGVRYIADRIPLVLLCVLAAGLSTTGARDHVAARGAMAGFTALFLVDALLTSASWGRQGARYADFLSRTAVLGMAASPAPDGGAGTVELVHLDVAGKRGGGLDLACRPLPGLLTLTGIAAAPTFADPTQQPLRLAGPLADAIAGGGRTADPMHLRQGQPGIPLLEGFDLVIACAGRGPTAIEPDEGVPLLSGSGWTLLAAPARERGTAPEEPLLLPAALP